MQPKLGSNPQGEPPVGLAGAGGRSPESYLILTLGYSVGGRDGFIDDFCARGAARIGRNCCIAAEAVRLGFALHLGRSGQRRVTPFTAGRASRRRATADAAA
jgi:hypothetical protein